MTNPAVDPVFAITIPARDEAVRNTLSRARKWLENHDVAQDQCGYIEIALAEALNNIVEHAFADRPDGAFDMVMRREEGELAIAIRDNGRAMPDLEVPEGRLPPRHVPRADLPEGGFGWYLIRSLTTYLSYDRLGEENRLDMRFAL